VARPHCFLASSPAPTIPSSLFLLLSGTGNYLGEEGKKWETLLIAYPWMPLLRPPLPPPPPQQQLQLQQ